MPGICHICKNNILYGKSVLICGFLHKNMPQGNPGIDHENNALTWGFIKKSIQKHRL